MIDVSTVEQIVDRHGRRRGIDGGFLGFLRLCRLFFHRLFRKCIVIFPLRYRIQQFSKLRAKITKMIEGGSYCIDVMQQNLAVTGLLKSAHQMLTPETEETLKAIDSKVAKLGFEVFDDYWRRGGSDGDGGGGGAG